MPTSFRKWHFAKSTLSSAMLHAASMHAAASSLNFWIQKHASLRSFPPNHPTHPGPGVRNPFGPFGPHKFLAVPQPPHSQNADPSCELGQNPQGPGTTLLLQPPPPMSLGDSPLRAGGWTSLGHLQTTSLQPSSFLWLTFQGPDCCNYQAWNFTGATQFCRCPSSCFPGPRNLPGAKELNFPGPRKTQFWKTPSFPPLHFPAAQEPTRPDPRKSADAPTARRACGTNRSTRQDAGRSDGRKPCSSSGSTWSRGFEGGAAASVGRSRLSSFFC